MNWRNFFINAGILLVLSLLIVFGVAFNSSTSWFASDFAILILLLAIPLLWPLKNTLRFTADNPDMIADRPVTRLFTLTYGRWLPNLFLLDSAKTHTWHLPIGQRTAKISLTLQRGIYDQLPMTVTVTDLFGWFRKTLPLRLATPITVGPARRPEAAARIADDFSQKMSAADAGLPSDRIKNFRDYFPGDNIQQIAWKVSAHADTLIVHDDEHEGQASWTLLLLITPTLSLEPALSLFASLMDTGIFSGNGYLLDSRLTSVIQGRQNTSLANFEPDGTATPDSLAALTTPQHQHRAYLILTADTQAAVPFTHALAPAATTLVDLSGGDDHA
ncbi:DUF58 domain-containing protein [Lacticaseibacillus paracasei]|uniref:DUF58 domain-containing protein n=1 Tax=Lacticaseibacillus paracasei TaxID=1597 RepID=UPI001403B597|nr:DUF58 domain-containing protein [Lacticaseibacillus paracasei]